MNRVRNIMLTQLALVYYNFCIFGLIVKELYNSTKKLVINYKILVRTPS